WTAGDPERYRSYAGGLVALAPDVVLATTTPTVLAVQRASRSVPIVFVGVIDAVGSGLVRSLAQPGGNATGFLLFEYSIASKWLELLKEIAPRVARVAVLRDAATAAGVGQFAAVQTVAPIGVELRVIGIDDHGEIERDIAALARGPNGGLIVTANRVAVNHPGGMAALVAALRFSSIASPRGRRPPVCPVGRRGRTSWISISRPARRWASKCRRRCWRAPTR